MMTASLFKIVLDFSNLQILTGPDIRHPGPFLQAKLDSEKLER